MSSTPSNLGKSLSSSASHSPAIQNGPVTTSFESNRRPSQPISSHSNSSTPRKGQAARKQHKNQRRPGLGGSRHNSSLDNDDAMAEMRAVRNASSRRGQTSITHLLNYTVPSRIHPSDFHQHSHYARTYRRNPTWGPGSGHHAADKARYVHANYRFVVSPEGHYATQAVDADEHLQWNDVLQVLASSQSQAASCPICLSEPVAPRMAKCGHIFCLPCLIRFMSASAADDDSRASRGARWKKCPICEDSVYLHETRPVRFYAGQESPLPRAGDDVVLRLMARTAKSTLALPCQGDADALNVGNDIPWHYAANVFDYARIMKGTGGYMTEQYDEEIEALQKQETEDQLLYHADDEWTQKAIRAINAAKEKVQDLGRERGAESAAVQGRAVKPDFFFYSSQPHLYLSALDIRILKTKYGDFSAFPSTLLPRVEHISTGHVMDDYQRKKAKYLSHLPHGCIVSFLECDWTDIVPAEILDKFADDIEKRRRRNRDKAAQEDRERVQAERIEAAAIRSSAGTTRRDYESTPMMIEDDDRVPALNSDDFQPLLSSQSQSQSHVGTTPPDPRLGFAHLASVSTSPSAQRTVWGTPAVATSPDLTPSRHPHGIPRDDGWLNDEELLGAAELSFQMEAFGIDANNSAEAQGQERGSGEGLGGTSGGDASGTGGGGGKGKKKKKQKITLMSTGGRRGQ